MRARQLPGEDADIYVGQDWINSRDVTGEDPVQAQQDGRPSSSGMAGTGNSQSRAPKLKYIRAPDPGDTRTNKVCPICQEEFESEYMKDDGVDDWVWLDAVKVGERAFHASCLAAATKDRGGTPSNARATPEPVLGKRKAEVSACLLSVLSRPRPAIYHYVTGTDRVGHVG
jgi:pre-mRNA cleavage complex 2 protein Pcf11